MLLDKAQQIMQAPATGMTVGVGTAAYGMLVEIATWAQVLGVIFGFMLTTGLFIEFVIRKLKERNGPKS